MATRMQSVYASAILIFFIFGLFLQHDVALLQLQYLSAIPIGISRHISKHSSLTSNIRYFAGIGITSNPNYLFPLLVTAKVWKRLGVDLLVCAAGTEESYMRVPRSAYVVQNLRKQGAQLIFLDTKLAPSHTIAQTCRIFISASPQINVADDDIIISGDSDWWPFRIDTHVPSGDQQIFLYNSRCCRKTSNPLRKGKKFPMFPMASMGMSARLWKNLTGVNKGWLSDGDVLSNYLYKEFGIEYIKNGRGKPKISGSWYADQIMMSEKIDDYMKEKDWETLVGEYKHVRKEDRLDRISWKSNFSDVDITTLQDAHILHPLHEENNWRRTLPLLHLLFDNDTVGQLNLWRNVFVALEKKNITTKTSAPNSEKSMQNDPK